MGEGLAGLWGEGVDRSSGVSVSVGGRYPFGVHLQSGGCTR